MSIVILHLYTVLYNIYNIANLIHYRKSDKRNLCFSFAEKRFTYLSKDELDNLKQEEGSSILYLDYL